MSFFKRYIPFGSHIPRGEEVSPAALIEALRQKVISLGEVASLRGHAGYHQLEAAIAASIHEAERKIVKYAANPEKYKRELIYHAAYREVAVGFLSLVETADANYPNLIAQMEDKLRQFEETTTFPEASGVDLPETTPEELASRGI